MCPPPSPTVAPHPLLRAAVFRAELPASGPPLGELPSPPWLTALLAPGAPVPDPPGPRDEELRKRIRDLLRHGGYKPTGRGKPSSEYLVRAADEGQLGPINLLVDACNAVSLGSGFPISVVDADLARPPLSIDVAAPGSRYVFNPSGQEIDVSGLLCLFDAEGPCANAVKDAQRTKTHAGTRRALVVVWGLASEPERTDGAARWYRDLLERAGLGTA